MFNLLKLYNIDYLRYEFEFLKLISFYLIPTVFAFKIFIIIRKRTGRLGMSASNMVHFAIAQF